MTKVDLKAKPFNLSDEDIKWVQDTIADMTIEEKIGQLFVNMGASRNEEYLTGMLTIIISVLFVTTQVQLKKYTNKIKFFKKTVKFLY